MHGRAALELVPVCIARIENAKIVAGPTQRRNEVAPPVHTMHRASSDFDSPGQASCLKTAVGSDKALRQPDWPIALALGGEHHGVPTFGEHLDHAVEVA